MAEPWSAWPAPAKLNLFLRIVGRRIDGYHLLQTLYQLLDWGDRIRLRVRRDGIIACNDLPGIEAGRNLALRAATELKAFTGTSMGADIVIEKKVPAGAGLGGGSSDAASVLVGLNELWRTNIAVGQLARIGLSLGADVPVFVQGRTAWAEGIGDELTPIVLPAMTYVIVDPGEHVVTAELFQAAELTRNSAPTTISAFLDGTCTTNAFTPVVRARSAKIAAALDWLGKFGDARLSGSGGCVFVAADSERRAHEIAGACPREFGVHVANGVNDSPLYAVLEHYRGRAEG